MNAVNEHIKRLGYTPDTINVLGVDSFDVYKKGRLSYKFRLKYYPLPIEITPLYKLT